MMASAVRGHKSRNGYQHWRLDAMCLSVAGLETTFYYTKNEPTKPTTLFIHGIGGDYHGMVPLAYEMRANVNVLIIELPGHGSTAIPNDVTLAWWQKWSEKVLEALRKENITVDKIVAHSFGCLPAQAMARTFKGRITLLNLVSHPTRVYSQYAQMMYTFRYILLPTYTWYPFALLRGLGLLYHPNYSSLTAIRWISHMTKTDNRKFLYQTTLGNQLQRTDLLRERSLKNAPDIRIILGSHDTFSSIGYYELCKILPNTPITILPGGHMLPIERAEEVAKVLLR